MFKPFSTKARLWTNGRINQHKLITSRLKHWDDSPRIWIHAASYGEFEMSRPIIDKIKASHPTCKFVISFFSPSGYENIELDKNDFLKIYLPIDIKQKHHQMLTIIKPKAVIFIKYEFWFNFLQQLKSLQIPYYFTSLHLNKESYLFKSPFASFKNLLQSATKIYCHNPDSLDILLNNGFKNVELFGDSRVEQVLQNATLKSILIKWNEPATNTIAFGSVTTYELPYIIDIINTHPQNNFILAPHDVEEVVIKQLKRKIKIKISYLSDFNEHFQSEKVLIVDTYGDLKYLYANADAAYVGAGFEKGPHNILEPLVFKIPVFCGPNIKKFPMAQYLSKIDLIQIIDKPENLPNIFDFLSTNDTLRIRMKSTTFFKESTTKIENLVTELNLIK